MSNGNIHNAYPELPVLPYAHTTIAMTDVVNYVASAAIQTPVKRAAYVIFRNESGNGHQGINNNYVGLQADGHRLPDRWTPSIAGTCVHAENMTGNLRRFICFRTWTTCADILFDRVNSRGLYVGGFAHPYANMQINTNDDWPLAYWREWVTGSGSAPIPPQEKTDLLAQYAAAVHAFP